MAPSGEFTLPATKRARKSIGAHLDMSRAMERENATVDVGSTLAANRKKSRSARPLLCRQIPPRSILKPTIAPLAEIPPLKRGKQSSVAAVGNARGPGATANEPSGSKIALKTEEEQQAAAREREERERRDARRKSLANRRVSFAAEATLHTFHEVEFDAKASAAASKPQNNQGFSDNQGDGQRKKRNSIAAQSNFHNVEDDTATSMIYSSDSEPADAVEEIAADEEEEVEEDSNSDSDDGTMMSVVTEEITGTSIGSDVSTDEGDESATIDEALRMAARRAATQQLDEDSDDGEEIIPSFGWAKKGNQQSSTQANRPKPSIPTPQFDVEQDDDGTEMDMEMDTDMEMTRAMGKIIKPTTVQSEPEQEQEMSMDVTRAFGGILSQNKGKSILSDSGDGDDVAMEEATMEFTTAIGGIHRTQATTTDEFDDDKNEDMSMELTSVMGGLLSQQKANAALARRRTLNRKSEAVRMDDATMDMTVGLGKIISAPPLDEEDEGDVSMAMDATMGMDMTVGLGRIISAPKRNNDNRNEDATMGMDMTVGLGRIISAPSQGEYDDEGNGDVTMGMEATMGMDMTMAIGGIIKNAATSPQPSEDLWLLDKTDKKSAEKDNALESQQSLKKALLGPGVTKTPESSSPGIRALQNKALRLSLDARTPTDTQDQARTPSPTKPSTPLHGSAVSKRALQRTPQSSPMKSSPVRSSPIRTPQSALKNTPRQANTSRTPSPVNTIQRLRRSFYRSNPDTGTRTPTVVLTPQGQKPAAVGVDITGLGSPKVAALFDRRESLSDSASKFVPGRRIVAFENPKALVEEVDKERHEELNRETLRKPLGRNLDGPREDKDATLNLREMINSLSPKRNPMRGRKSLHVGSARGLLGKRPQESEDEEDAEDNDGIKRLRGHQGSPVKNVRLQQPPSKEETTGRLTNPFRKSLGQGGKVSTTSFSSPLKGESATPRNQARFKDNQTVHDVSMHESPAQGEAQQGDGDDERIHLQDFLDMTSIRFMELTTTKRRPTMMPTTSKFGESGDGEDDLSLERCVVAGACTVPMLELYQHSCRELKKYIAEGRRIVKEIETETFEDNPHLFREYITATPEVKALMDNQFKNVKTHARHLSKAMWYEWRMKLQDGLKEGLISISEGMKDDEKLLKQEETLLTSVMPAVMSRYESLLEESSQLEEVVKELADCDPVQLENARDELVTLDEDIAEKKRLIAKLRRDFQESEADVEQLSAQKQKYLEEIKEAEVVREESRGWTSNEVNSFKERVDAVEKEHGWTVTGISGSTLSMTYKREIEIVFDITSFQSHQPNSRIDLWYIADSREANPLPKTVEKEFFLQCIRDHVRAMPQSRTKISDLLSTVRTAWDKANIVSHQVDRINVTFPTKVTKTSDSSISMTSSLLLIPLETRVEVTLNLSGFSGPDGVNVDISTEAKVLYGEQFNVGKVGEFLATRIGNKVGSGDEEWSNVVLELHEKLIARGTK
ncbi:Kinetochore spc7-like protein [Cladobotryum mycophilum]|uniref:Kinetochore spc7-like protein n=1 Tax=Cladobotryum mycophilum TaxID=491253 RepID=A0ABR0SLT1_9HYPO